jgi:hypothetical protein
MSRTKRILDCAVLAAFWGFLLFVFLASTSKGDAIDFGREGVWMPMRSTIASGSFRHYLGPFGNEEEVLFATSTLLPIEDRRLGWVQTHFDLIVVGDWSDGARWSFNVDGRDMVSTFPSDTDGLWDRPSDYERTEWARPLKTMEIDTLGYDEPNSVYLVREQIEHSDPIIQYRFKATGLEEGEWWGIDNMLVMPRAIPEPSTLALVVVGLVGFTMWVIRKKRRVPNG